MTYHALRAFDLPFHCFENALAGASLVVGAAEKFVSINQVPRHTRAALYFNAASDMALRPNAQLILRR
jgi:hypothetical protein